MNQHIIPIKTKIALLITVILWASAFVGIRAGLEGYSPGGLALLRFLIASICMSVIYFRSSRQDTVSIKDKILLMLIGAIGLGWYSIALNYGEISVSSGVSSFIISQSPIVTTIFAVIFFSEKFTLLSLCGMLISVVGVFMISMSETHGFHFTSGMYYILLATIVGGFYSILQKPFLKKCHAIDATSYIIWGSTIALLMYTPDMLHEIKSASYSATLAIVYLGVFPAAIAYVLWSYVLAVIPTSRAVSFLYFMPIIATLLGWLWLKEVPSMVSFVGGLVALIGVWLVNQAYKIPPVLSKPSLLQSSSKV